MINEICCVIPVKKNSRRLKNKNFLLINKKSLFEAALEKSIKSKLFRKIFISSDNLKLKKFEKNGVEFLKRSKKLSKDPATITDVMLDICFKQNLIQKKFKILVVISVTNPFFSLSDLRESIQIFKKSNFQGLLSVSKNNSPPFNAWMIKRKKLVPAFKNSKYKFTKSTECPETFFSNGAIRIVKIKEFMKKKNFHNLNLTYFEMKNEKSIDIDTKFDYTIARKLINEKK